MVNYVHPSATVGENCRIGWFSVTMENVSLGRDVTIGNNVTIYPGTILGNGVTVGDNSVLGKQPRPAKTSTVKIDGELPPLVIGDNTTVGTGAVIYAGTIIGENCLVADLASIREKCTIADCVIIGRGVAVENQVTIGSYTKIQTGAYITAYTIIEDYVFIAPMVTTTNDNYMGRTQERFKYIKGPTIRRGARVGGGSITLPGVTVAQESFIAAGALVTKDTEPGMVYKGLPAKLARVVPPTEMLKTD
ncbi:UDP-3-O-(3-hydroxymyristoyl) glucosamine N-acyltransferase [Clostridiales bacterium PH28_bin88]|nr:UDP-3-O-(3-hydroxymyristoyl) glucosamine N-acyltransferase [Clostridiales bacterium PH28_bin88]